MLTESYSRSLLRVSTSDSSRTLAADPPGSAANVFAMRVLHSLQLCSECNSGIWKTLAADPGGSAASVLELPDDRSFLKRGLVLLIAVGPLLCTTVRVRLLWFTISTLVEVAVEPPQL